MLAGREIISHVVAKHYMDLLAELAVPKGFINRCCESRALLRRELPEAPSTSCARAAIPTFFLFLTLTPRKNKASRHAIHNPSLANESLGTAPRWALRVAPALRVASAAAWKKAEERPNPFQPRHDSIHHRG